MNEYERWAAWYANTWVSPTTCRRKSTISLTVRVVLTGLSLLFALLIIEELTGFMVLDSEHSKPDTSLQNKIYWHSSIKNSGYE